MGWYCVLTNFVGVIFNSLLEYVRLGTVSYSVLPFVFILNRVENEAILSSSLNSQDLFANSPL